MDRNNIGVTIKDISKTGIAIVTNKNLKVSDVIDIMFKDNGILFQEKGKIVRIQQLGNLFLYGCEFLSLNSNIEKYIKTKQNIENA